MDRSLGRGCVKIDSPMPPQRMPRKMQNVALGPGPGRSDTPEMLQNGLLGASWAHFAAWDPKYSKTASWKLLGPTLRPGARNAPKPPSGGFLGPLAGWGRECVKTTFWRPLGPTLRPGTRNASKRPPGGLLAPLCGLFASLGARFLSQFGLYPKPGGSLSITICVVS